MGQLFAAASQQIAKDALLDVEDVVRPLGHVLALERLKYLGIAPEGSTDGILGRVVPHADHLFNFVVQPPVAEHLQMGGKDRRVIVAQLLGDMLAVIALISRESHTSFFSHLNMLSVDLARLIVQNQEPMGWIIYAIAVYFGFKFSAGGGERAAA